ncbi:hypothetical protein ACTXT7_007766 [Hymenolepis weldensis]
MSRRRCFGVMIDICFGIYVQTRKQRAGPPVDIFEIRCLADLVFVWKLDKVGLIDPVWFHEINISICYVALLRDRLLQEYSSASHRSVEPHSITRSTVHFEK